MSARRLRAEFTDDGGTDTVPHMVDDLMAEHGRGMWLVRQLSDDCGSWQDDQGRTTVWFEIVTGEVE